MAELVCATVLLCAAEIPCVIVVLDTAELLPSDVDDGMLVTSAMVFVSQKSLVTAGAVSKAVLMPFSNVVVAATSIVESIVAYGSVSQVVW